VPNHVICLTKSGKAVSVPTSSFGPSLRIPSTSLPIEPLAVPQFQPYKMVVYYQIAGKKVGSHVLAMATLGSMFAGTWLAMSGGEKPKTAQGPPINASSKDEENFVQNFMKEVDGGEKKPAAGH
ncbi:hypothetical protein N7471_012218, partial [Penicillium samsonianum]|uniref:uncharacterized protein n=1 Tax=Penicillium samsonianum TaxID=1882272 RepID=UPI0025491AF1